MAVSPKTIYLEVDEEITSVIDKLRKTEFSNVVLMIPKGASISQSVVNLKLIKKKAEELGKSISIVTGDKVARTLAEKLGIPAASSASNLEAVDLSEDKNVKPAKEVSTLIETSEVIGDKKLGLENTKPFPATVSEEEPDEIVVTEGDEEDDPMEEEGFQKHHLGENIVTTKTPDNLMPKFPWKKVLIFGGIPLFALLIIAYIYLPRAKATIYMASESRQVSVDIAGSKDSKLDAEKAVIPTQIVEATKETSNKFTATGKKDAGTKATGKLEVYLSAGKDPRTWVAGTRIQLGSDSSLIYLTNSEIKINPSSVVQIDVTAQNPGEKYNVASDRDFIAVNDSIPAITSVTAMTGGTTKQVTVVTQTDVNSAKDSLTKNATTEAEAEFSSKTSDMKVVDDSKKTEVLSATASPAVDQAAADFTLTIKVRVRAVAVANNDLSEIIKSEVGRQLGSTLQVIDDGSSTLKFNVNSADLETGKIAGTISTTAYVANKLDENKIKAELTGLNNTQATNYLASVNGVESSKLEYFPPFIRNFPRVKNHIYVIVTVSDSSRK